MRDTLGRLPLVLLYNPASQVIPLHPRDSCHLTTDRTCLATADAVIFDIPTMREPCPPKAPGQLWVAHSRESEALYPQLKDDAYMRRFDLTMTYRLDSDLPIPYLDEFVPDDLLVPPREKDAQAPVAFFCSSPLDRSGRTAYARELMRHVEVHSYGKILRNRTLAGDSGRVAKEQTIARYQFTLAFENSVARDYVTEKLFQPLRMGSVPVYLGAPNVAAFVPTPECFINVANFAGPADLARHLTSLSREPAAYERYHAWRQNGLTPAFHSLMRRFVPDAITRLGHRLQEAPGSPGEGWRQLQTPVRRQ